jgi:hypothetical protein|tara:strand:- start:543 stop:983 length:441 start_codon:yes stop_codon:yes gene_type:complete
MGYRSEVSIVTRKDNKELCDILKAEYEQDKDLWDIFEEGTIKMYNGQKEEILYVQCDYVKWYDGYKTVDDIMSAISRIEDEESYGFVRIGEEWNDVETMGYPYDYGLTIHRYAEFSANFLTDEEICICNNLDHQTLNVDCPVNKEE